MSTHRHEKYTRLDADQLDSVAFTDVQYFVLDYVRTELWHDFSVYPPYVARIHESALTPRHWDNYIPNVSAADMTAVLAKLDKMDPADILAKALTLPMDQLANVALAHKIHRDTLLLLLHDKIAHRIFKKFLASRMKDHFVVFVDEVDEFINLPGIEFMQHTAKKLFKKYLSEHAKLQVDMSTKMRQDIQAKLNTPSIDMFKSAIVKVKTGLLQDSLVRYLKSPIHSEMKQEFPDLVRNLMSAVDKGKVDLPQLESILSNPTYLTNFRKYLKTQHAAENLIFLEEAFAAKVDADQLDSVAFTDVQYFVLDYVRTELWHDFSVYPPYVARIHESALTPRHWDNYVPNVSAADMTAVLAKLDKMDPADILAKALTLPMDQLANVALAHKIHRDTLLLLLHDKIAHRIFKKFLASRMKDHFVVFVDEVDEFINLPGIEFMQHTAKKLFKKYLSEHAKLQVDMSTKMRQDIQAKLNTPSIDMFKSAIVKVKTGILCIAPKFWK
ncbi:hypothetical protein DYB31_013420 [Aphanomyces astaci]|uniref:RGS domain-containing protein n=1 Tax=Aphanomyces astaci TaxID=112090 RepID=A0A397ETM2_APHAT|nr:hypothetical protein DYB31_013420 [Aphanomyces astaci]